MSQGGSTLRTQEKGNEVGNLKRVGASARAGAPATGPSETPKGRRQVSSQLLGAARRPKRRSPREEDGWKHPAQVWIA
jgi:hypothetical protein